MIVTATFSYRGYRLRHFCLIRTGLQYHSVAKFQITYIHLHFISTCIEQAAPQPRSTRRYQKKETTPKMPRAPKPQKPRHDPLHVELEADDSLRRFGRVSKSARQKARSDDGEDGPGNVSSVIAGNFLVVADVNRLQRMLERVRGFWIWPENSRMR